jgi:hypothetical protein
MMRPPSIRRLHLDEAPMLVRRMLFGLGSVAVAAAFVVSLIGAVQA